MIHPTIIFLLLLRPLSSQEFSKDFFPPTLPRPKENPGDSDVFTTVPLGRDPKSGCMCREVPEKFVVCFGRETCVSFPKDVVVKPRMLRVKTTHILGLKIGDMNNLTHLITLEIEGNTVFEDIEEGTFMNMTNLRNLSLSFNEQLRALKPKTFEGLINLKHLYLVQNGFKQLRAITGAFAPNILPNLYKLGLSENSFKIIEENDFLPMALSSLEELNLILCQIEYIHPNSLSPLINLRTLRIGENTFNTTTVEDLIENTIEMGIPLKALNLYGIGLRKTPPKKLLTVISRSNITYLCLARNQFEAIEENTFPEMPNLEILDLREILVLNVTKKSFNGLPNLRTLLLGGNKLSSIPDGVLLDQLTYLDISSNSGDSFYPTYFNLGKKRFRRMKKLNFINLSFNRINTLSNDTFFGLTNLVVLGLKNATIFHIGNGSFSHLPNLAFLNLENNPFGYTYGITREMLEGLEHLEVLILNGCSIQHLSAQAPPFAHLKSLKHLGLARNRLVTVSASVFLNLKNLASLDISQNYLTSWHERLFTNNNLSKIIASDNKLTHFTEEMMQDFMRLRTLDVTGNPFTCDCHTIEVINRWGMSSSFRTLVHCVIPEIYSNLTLDQFVTNKTSTCEINKLHTLLSLAIPTTVILLLILIISFVVYKFRWYIRYWVFLARLNLTRRIKTKPKQPKKCFENFEYDAFVSYSNEDRNFVIRLVAMLENFEPFLRLCVYERDFEVGSIISESVLESVAKSRKTILIISDSYARSHWCRWEAQIAEHHRLFFENEFGDYVDDSLILIKLGPVCDKNITPTLRYLLKTRVYLPWDADTKKQKVFWEKLRNALNTKTVPNGTV